MIRIASEEQLFNTFRETDRDQVQLPANFKFPMVVKDYLNWTEPSGFRVYLVFEDPHTKAMTGVVFQRTQGAHDVASMCQWCHSVRVGGSVSLLTAEASRTRRVGLHLCSNLNCKENTNSSPSIHDFSEGLSGFERTRRVLERMSDFTKRNLF